MIWFVRDRILIFLQKCSEKELLRIQLILLNERAPSGTGDILIGSVLSLPVTSGRTESSIYNILHRIIPVYSSTIGTGTQLDYVDLPMLIEKAKPPLHVVGDIESKTCIIVEGIVNQMTLSHSQYEF